MRMVPPDPSSEITGADRDAMSRALTGLIYGETITRLQAIGTIRRLLPAFEEDAVRHARLEGHSWLSIATWARMSRQSVHKRWRKRLYGDAYDPTSGRRRPDRLPPRTPRGARDPR